MVFFWASHEPERKDHRMSKIPETVPMHSSGWVAQVWISFVAAVGVTMMGIWFLPVDGWVKGFMGMGLLFSVGSTFSLAKTVRDQHEAESLRKRLDDARVNRMIAEHDPLRPAL
jgi:hypothetical protein